MTKIEFPLTLIYSLLSIYIMEQTNISTQTWKKTDLQPTPLPLAEYPGGTIEGIFVETSFPGQGQSRGRIHIFKTAGNELLAVYGFVELDRYMQSTKKGSLCKLVSLPSEDTLVNGQLRSVYHCEHYTK